MRRVQRGSWAVGLALLAACADHVQPSAPDVGFDAGIHAADAGDAATREGSTAVDDAALDRDAFATSGADASDANEAGAANNAADASNVVDVAEDVLTPTEPMTVPACPAPVPAPDAGEASDAMGPSADAPNAFNWDTSSCPSAVVGPLSAFSGIGWMAAGGIPCGDAGEGLSGDPDCKRFIYSFHADATSRFGARVPHVGGEYQLLQVRSRCNDPATSVNVSMLVNLGTAEYSATIGPGDYFLVFETDRAGSGGSYTAGVAQVASNYDCSSPIVVDPCEPTPASYGLAAAECNPGYGGPQGSARAYAVRVSPGQIVRLDGPARIRPCTIDSCDAPIMNRRYYDAAGALFVFRATDDGAGVVATVHDPLPNSRCTSAARLPLGTLAGQNVGWGLPLNGWFTHQQHSGRTLYYTTTIPPRSTARFHVEAGWRALRFGLFDDCAPTEPQEGSYDWLTRTNDTDAALPVVLAATSTDPNVGSRFDLTTSMVSRTDAAPNSFCSNALPLEPGDEHIVDFAQSYQAAATCEQYQTPSGGGLYFVVELSPGQHGALLVPEARRSDIEVRTMSSCGACPSPVLSGGTFEDNSVDYQQQHQMFPLSNDSPIAIHVVVQLSLVRGADTTLPIRWVDSVP